MHINYPRLGNTLLKIAVFTAVLSFGFYFLILNPGISRGKQIAQVRRIVTGYQAELTQNRIAFVGLTKLNLRDPNFPSQKSTLVGTILKTNEAGLQSLSASPNLPSVNRKLTARFPDLLADTAKFYEDQKAFLDRVFQTSSYSTGVDLLTGPESSDLVTRQTNLILEYDFWLSKIN